jgi:predicted RNase H-like HicB family nuclease
VVDMADTVTLHYDVDVTREDGTWLASVPALPGAHTYARTLPQLDSYLREVIGLTENYRDDVLPQLQLALYIDTGDAEIDHEAAGIRHDRAELDHRRDEVEQRTRRAVCHLRERGYSLRDTGRMLGISYQRAQQLVATGDRD